MKLSPAVGSLSRMETSLDPLSAMIRSSRPSPLTSATVMPAGSVPVKKPWPSFKRRTERPVPQPGEDEDVVAAAVGDDQVENPVVVEVRQRDRRSGRSSRLVTRTHLPRTVVTPPTVRTTS